MIVYKGVIMDTKALLSEKQAHEAESLNAVVEQPEAPELVEDLTREESRERSKQAHARLRHLIWHDPSNLDGKTLPNDWHVPISRSGSHGTRTVDASPWIDSENYDDGRVVQVQLQTWRDQVDHYGEHGGILPFSSAEQPPIPSLWIRVRSADSTTATDGEEAFRFPAPDVTFFRGEHIPQSTELWQKAEELITTVESWRAK